MNKYALLTVAAIPGQGSGTSAFKAPEVWKTAKTKVEVQLVFGPDEGDEEDQSEGPPSDDPYTKMADRYNRDIQALRALRDHNKRKMLESVMHYSYDPYKLEA